MKNLLFVATCLMALASCQNSGSTGTADSTAVDSTATAPVAEPAAAQPTCYLFADGKDSTTVSLNITADGTVTGSYDWTPWEKDGAHGTLTGKKEGDLLKLMYDYTIEGSNQQQEMLMKLTGDQLAEGETELVEGEGGVLKIKDPTKVTWKPFVKVDCR
jgi:hypothetical protein